MKIKHFLSGSVVALCAILAACGGGGGGGGTTPPTTSPSSTPTATATPGTATGTGVVVDHDTGAPLAGIKVGLAPKTPGATPNPQGTTAADGSFTVQATPGTYMLVIGNNVYPDPSNRATIHDMVTLTAGTNNLAAWQVPGILCGSPNNLNPCPSPSPVEESTKFRLATLTSAEQACISLENTTRSQKSLNGVVSDEWLTEQNRFYWSIATATNSLPAYPSAIGYGGGDGNGADCSDMIASDFVLQGFPSYAGLAYFAGDSGGAHNVATSQGMVDPRMSPLPGPPYPANPWP